MDIILEVVSAIIIYVFATIMYHSLYEKRPMKIFIEVFIYAVFVVAMLMIGSLKIPILNVAYTFISMCILNKLLFEFESLYFILYNALLTLVMLVIDMVSVLLFSVTIKTDLSTILANKYLMTASCLLNWLVLLIAFRIFMMVISKDRFSSVKLQEVLFYIILIGMEVFLLHYITSIISDKSTGIVLLLLLAVYLAFDIYIVYLIYKISKANQYKNDLRLARQQSNMQLAVYRELSDKYHLSRAVAHDVREHIKALEGLIDNNYIESAMQYTKLLNRELDKLTPEFKVSNQILSIIINNKLAQAERSNIELILDIEDLSIDFISDLDITSIFANILDNAFEACSELKEKDRTIKLTIHQINSFLVVNISNKYKKIRQDSDGRYLTTKEDHEGFGLSNVKRAVERYDGVFNVETNQGLFVVKITIPMLWRG